MNCNTTHYRANSSSVPGDPTVCVKIGFWLNTLMFAANLLPAFPFDGGNVLRTVLTFPQINVGERHATAIVTRLGQLIAIVLLIVALCLPGQSTNDLIPYWLPLSVVAFILFFGGEMEHRRTMLPDEEEHPFGYDFSQGYTSLEKNLDDPREKLGPLTRWMEQRREARNRRQQEVEADEERRVDEVLARLHEVGLEKLTPEERSLLQRVSARYRNRTDGEA